MTCNNEMNVWFMRHGKAAFDYENCAYDELMEMLSNSLHTPLVEEHGIDFTSFPQNVELVCHSSAQRALDTANELKEHLKAESVKQLNALHEVRFDKDIITGQEFKSIEVNRCDILRRWYKNENKSESFEQSMERVRHIEAFLQDRPEKSIILVTHGWFLRLLEIYFVRQKQEGITFDDLKAAKLIDFGQFIETTLKTSHIRRF